MVTQTMIERAKEGDAFAFEQIYNETIKGAYYVARKFLGTDTAAEDVLQESYIKVYEKLGEYQAGNFQGWVDVIVANRCKDYLKKKNPLLFSEMQSDDGVEFDKEDTREEFIPDRKVDYDETKRLVKEIIDKLPIDQKMSVVMFYYEQMSVKEIATAMECSENTIKSRLNYGRKTIKAEVEKLEKKGTKLYCAPILPFLLWLFKEEAKACEVPANFTVGNAIAKKAAEAGKANIASSAAKAGLSLGVKIGIGAAAAVVVAGGITAAVLLGGNQNDGQQYEGVGIYEDGSNGKTTSDVSEEAEAKDIDVDQIVEEFMADYDGNQYFDESAYGRSIVNEAGKYVYYWQGDLPVIVIENVSRKADGSAEDYDLYSFFTVDTVTGDVSRIEYSGKALYKITTGCEIYTGANDTIVQVFDSIWNDTGLDTYYKLSSSKTEVAESVLSTDDGMSMISGSDYTLAEWVYLGEKWTEPVTSTDSGNNTVADNTGSDEAYEREWAEPNTDNPYFFFHGEYLYLPIEKLGFSTGEWTHAYTNDSAGREEVFMADGSPIYMTLYYDENKENIIKIILDTNNTDETNLFPMMLNGVSWNTPIDQAKEILGEPTNQTTDGLYQWYTFEKGDCYMTFGYRAGGQQIKYMEMGLIE